MAIAEWPASSIDMPYLVAVLVVVVPALAHAGPDEVREPQLAIGAGYHSDVAAMLELRLGYGIGTVDADTELTVLRRMSVAVRGGFGASDSGAASALAGISVGTPLVGASVDGGLDVRFDPDDRDLGPVLTATARIGKLGVFATGWCHVIGDNDWGFSTGLQYVSGATRP